MLHIDIESRDNQTNDNGYSNTANSMQIVIRYSIFSDIAAARCSSISGGHGPDRTTTDQRAVLSVVLPSFHRPVTYQSQIRLADLIIPASFTARLG